MPNKRFLGITVMSPFFQNEGVDGVLERVIQRAGATAVATNTSVVTPAPDGQGGFQPPSDAGASPRLFDRPIWGRVEGWFRSGPAHEPSREFFVNSPYKPREPNDLTASDGPIIQEFVQASKAAGLKVYMQTSAATPPGMREEDMPRLPNGKLPDGGMGDTGSLASPAIRAWNRAWTQDIFTHYPEIDGIRPDWPEYPCYKLDQAFNDFNPQVKVWAEAHDFDFEAIRQEVGAFYTYLHGSLTNRDLADFAGPDRGKYMTAHLFNRFPRVAEWFRLKAALSNDMIRDWREAVDAFGGPEKELSANAFMVPYTYFTGLDFAGAAQYCQSVSPKLYTMHWSLMVKFWGDALMAANPGLDEKSLVHALVHIMDLADPGQEGDSIADYGYPEPDEPHPVPNEPQMRKIDQAIAAARGQTQIYGLVHGYGPLDDFRRRLQLAADSNLDGIWINRYGYLSDEKLDAVGEIWR